MSNQCKNQISGSSAIVMEFLLAAMGIQASESQKRCGLMVLDETIKTTQAIERELFIADQKILARN